MPLWQKATPKGAAVPLMSGSDTETMSSSECSSSQQGSTGDKEKSASISSLSHVSGGRVLRLRPPHLPIGTGACSNVSFYSSASANRTTATSNRLLRTRSNPEFSERVPREGNTLTTPLTQNGAVGRLQGGSCEGNVMRLLVVGAPQVGKSSLINSYRATITNNAKWPAAPVGICGFCGTTTVDPFPNHPVEPMWLCIDTPGKIYDTSNAILLEKLFAGVQWKTRLAGKGAVRPEDIKNIPTVPDNKAHQCIIVVPATDLIVDQGWITSVVQFKSRYSPAPDADGVVMYLRNLVFSIRSLLYDASPFVVITKMDLVGGAGNTAARRAITSLLSQCIPINRLYFCACPNDQSLHETRKPLSLDRDTRESFLHLHEDLSLTFRWRMSIAEHS